MSCLLSWGCLLFYIFGSCLPTGRPSTHCHISAPEETQRPSFSSPWPWDLIFYGSFLLCVPVWQRKHYECLRTTFSSIPLGENLWKVVPRSYKNTLLWLLLLIAIGFSPIVNLVSRVHGEDGGGTCDLGHGYLFSCHLSLKCELREVCSNVSYTQKWIFMFHGGFMS